MSIQTRPLYVIICDGGDGSSHLNYTFDSDLIAKLQEAYDTGRMTYDNGIGIDGDGFHYATLNVPKSVTAESLGICSINSARFQNLFTE